MEEKRFTKLSALVDDRFTIEAVKGYKFKSWNASTNTMKSEDQWFKDSRKLYQVETDKGLLDLSEGQLGQIMVKVSHAGASDVIGCTVEVKSNGKSGMDIRYYLNPQDQVKPEEVPGEWQ